MARKPETGLSAGARNLLDDLKRDGKAKIARRVEAATELETAGLIHLKKGTATLTRAGRRATSDASQRAEGAV